MSGLPQVGAVERDAELTKHVTLLSLLLVEHLTTPDDVLGNLSAGLSVLTSFSLKVDLSQGVPFHEGPSLLQLFLDSSFGRRWAFKPRMGQHLSHSEALLVVQDYHVFEKVFKTFGVDVLGESRDVTVPKQVESAGANQSV